MPVTIMTWTPDLLPGFERTTLPFPDDYDGRVIATLVRRRPSAPTGRAVLYVHGFVDYFFQTHLANAFLAHGFAFYALDLRKHGRSLLPGQHPNMCKDVREYDADLTAAIDVIDREEAKPWILLNGHSTGGLSAALYAADGARRDRIGTLALNSPFFDFNAPAVVKAIVTPFFALGAWFPFLPIPGLLPPAYGESIHRDAHGEWAFDRQWKPLAGFPVYLGWLRAIHRAHRRLHRGLGLTIPILVMHSDRSVRRRRWDPSVMQTDAVLDIADMRRHTSSLGVHASDIAISHGLHDLFLSRQEVRAHAMTVLFRWLERVAPIRG